MRTQKLHTEFVGLRMSADERQKLKLMAAGMGTSESAVVRKLLETAKTVPVQRAGLVLTDER